MMIANFLFLLVSGAGLLLRQTNVDAFVPVVVTRSAFSHHAGSNTNTKLHQSGSSSSDVATSTQKPTGTSFLPQETIEMAEQGSPVEKVKLAKDGTAAFVDVYEYARKIREGEMTWEDVDKADLETVRQS
jgi:hypothetical protein